PEKPAPPPPTFNRPRSGGRPRRPVLRSRRKRVDCRAHVRNVNSTDHERLPQIIRRGLRALSQRGWSPKRGRPPLGKTGHSTLIIFPKTTLRPPTLEATI